METSNRNGIPLERDEPRAREKPHRALYPCQKVIVKRRKSIVTNFLQLLLILENSSSKLINRIFTGFFQDWTENQNRDPSTVFPEHSTCHTDNYSGHTKLSPADHGLLACWIFISGTKRKEYQKGKFLLHGTLTIVYHLKEERKKDKDMTVNGRFV
jgi:hypothetical protein